MPSGTAVRHILHADFDAFYAAVEQREDPRIRGKPVVVGGKAETRGVVASASYEARRFGVRSAMPMRTALQRCPEAVRVDPRFGLYGIVSRQVMQIFRSITPTVEALSLDEAFLDVTDLVTDATPAESIARSLKTQVLSELGLTISVGVAASKSVAKIASDMDKPDGLTVVAPGTERDFLAPLTVDKLWGVGPKTAERLGGEGVTTVGQLASKPERWLDGFFGRMGPHMRRLAQGLDDSPVTTERERKSVSAETTLAQDTGDTEALNDLVRRLSERVGRHLARDGLRARTVKLKLRLSDFTTFTRQATPPEPIDSPDAIVAHAGRLLAVELKPGRLFRLVGVGVSGFASEDQVEPQIAEQPKLAGFE